MWRLAPSATRGRSVRVTRNFALLVAATCGNTFKFVYDEKDSVNKICLKPNSKEFEKLLDIDFQYYLVVQYAPSLFVSSYLDFTSVFIYCHGMTFIFNVARARVYLRGPRHATCRLYTAVAMKRMRRIIVVVCYMHT
jgi:hypothetical protein